MTYPILIHLICLKVTGGVFCDIVGPGFATGIPWWRHQMETFSPLCWEFTGHRWIPRTKARNAEPWCFFYLHLNKRLNKQSWGWWFETSSRSLWRHCNDGTWSNSLIIGIHPAASARRHVPMFPSCKYDLFWNVSANPAICTLWGAGLWTTYFLLIHDVVPVIINLLELSNHLHITPHASNGKVHINDTQQKQTSPCSFVHLRGDCKSIMEQFLLLLNAHTRPRTQCIIN